MAPAKKQAAPATGISFGDLGMYAAGGGMPEGDYAITDMTVQMYQATSQAGVSKGPARLGVMVTFHPLTDGEERKQFYSMGSNADKSFAPNPETGKGLVAVPGGPGSTLNESTNWALFLKSLYDSGLPNGIFTDDLSTLEGAWVHIANVPEPEERKQYRGSQTGEAAADQQQQNKTIAVVTEIKDDGKPWEGTGGKVETKPAGKANGKPATHAAAAEPEAAEDEEQDVMVHAVNAVSSVLEKNDKGLPKLMLRTSTFKALSKTPDVANAVMEKVFKTDASLNALLGQLGYALKGTQVVPA